LVKKDYELPTTNKVRHGRQRAQRTQRNVKGRRDKNI